MKPKNLQPRLSERINALRKHIAAPFMIRGTRRSMSFSTKKPFKSNSMEIPVYFVDPLYKMGSKEWLKKLNATINAAIGRAIYNPVFYESIDGKPIDAEKLPTIMVFGYYPWQNKGKPSKTMFEKTRNLKKMELELSSQFSHQRPGFEEAIVHGKIKPTFKEGKLSGGSREGAFHSNYPKLFEVRMTKREFLQIAKSVRKIIRQKGFNSAADVLQQTGNLKGVELKKLLQNFGVPERMPQETLSDHPVMYIFYLETLKVMKPKFIKTGLDYAKKLEKLNN